LEEGEFDPPGTRAQDTCDKFGVVAISNEVLLVHLIRTLYFQEGGCSACFSGLSTFTSDCPSNFKRLLVRTHRRRFLSPGPTTFSQCCPEVGALAVGLYRSPVIKLKSIRGSVAFIQTPRRAQSFAGSPSLAWTVLAIVTLLLKVG
jgi:hypothetical protein